MDRDLALGKESLPKWHIGAPGRIFSQSAKWEIEHPDVSMAHWEIGTVNCSVFKLSNREGSFLIVILRHRDDKLLICTLGTGRIISQAEGQSAMDAHGESLELPKHKKALVVSPGQKGPVTGACELLTAW